MPPPFLFTPQNIMNDKTITQPTSVEQERLDEVLENSTDYVSLAKRRLE